MRPAELAKYVVYRAPLLSRLMRPSYRYKIDPAQLAAMVGLIDSTPEGAVIEIGVAQGDTSVFLMEHLRTTGDHRPLLLFDTFSGFTPASIEIEVAERGKPRVDFDRFRYTDEAILRRNLERAGYTNFRIFAGDASKFDWSSVGPIAAVLVDVDLYQPTRDILGAVWPRIVPGGGIVVDDCVTGTSDDGAMQAYQEFSAAHGLSFTRIGAKGGLLLKPSGTAPAAPGIRHAEPLEQC